MLRNRIYYQVKPFIPRALRAAVRRRIALRLEARVQDVWPIMPGSEQTPPGWHGWPDGKKFALVLTHARNVVSVLERARPINVNGEVATVR